MASVVRTVKQFVGKEGESSNVELEMERVDSVLVEGFMDPPQETYNVQELSLWMFLLYFFGCKSKKNFHIVNNEEDEDCKEVWPEHTSNIFSRLTFSWFGKLLFLGFNQPIDHKDLWQMDPLDTAKYSRDKFAENWKLHSPSLLKTLHHAFGWKFYASAIPKFIYDCLQFTGPVVLGAIIDFLNEDPDNPEHTFWYGIGLAAVLLITYSVNTVLINIYFHINFRTGMHLRNAVVTAVYEKALRMSNTTRQEKSTGEIVDLMSNDAQRLNNITGYIHVLWSGPFQIFVSLGMLWFLLGFLPTLAGLLYMLLLIPMNSAFLRKLKKIRGEMIKFTDERVKWTNEVLQAIRAVKQYCYEIKFVQKINSIRAKELEKLRAVQYVKAANSWISYTSPIMVSVVSLSTFVLLGNPLTAQIIFPALTLFNILRFPLAMFPSMVSSTAEVWVSIKRLESFLLTEEMKPLKLVDTLPEDTYSGAPSSVYIHGNFSWTSRGDDEETLIDSNITLKNINLLIYKGAKVGVVGAVGSGKSSLISTLIGEVYGEKGAEIGIQGSISLVAQQAWIMNDSVRNNILFGSPYDETRYKRVIQACALLPDLKQLAAGDRTEIGEKGINLSGGQKQRISIARAVYQDNDIYVLDDPLSAVDAHVAKHIFDNVVCGMLKEKTVILVTHYLHLLPHLDYVVYMQDGQISEQGAYNQLRKAKGSFARLIKDYSSSHHDDEQEFEQETTDLGTMSDPALSLVIHNEDLDSVVQLQEGSTLKLSTTSGDNTTLKVSSDAGKNSNFAVTNTESEKDEDKDIIQREEREVGAVKLKNYLEYGKAAGSHLFTFYIIFGCLLAQVTSMASNWWISYWTDDPDFVRYSFVFYFLMYLVWCAVNAIVVGASNILIAFTVVQISRNLHRELLRTIIRAPMTFFESTPLGRILNRFAKDMDSIDVTLPDTMAGYIRTMFTCLGTLTLMCLITPISIVGLVPIMFFYYRVQLFYRASSRELKRIDSISRSPIFAHFSETLGGLTSIRAYNAGSRFIEANEQKTDYNNRAYFAMVTSNRWLSIRLETIATGILVLCVLLVVIDRGGISPSTAGLLLSYTFSVTGWLSWLVRATSEVEQQMNSVERVLFYSQLGVEPPFTIDYVTKDLTTWPSEGKISFNQVILKYREGLSQNALDGISFDIKPHEKIGICGRTGAGKSSILVALFRLVELYSGSITIDGVDISEIGLHTLRGKLGIIPQDPVLFTGDIRTNLDPFSQYSDEAIWNVLEMVQMKRFVHQLPGQLEYQVAEMGIGFSVGQRQLLSFARALLRKVEILLLDEATASCDLETDNLIQTTLREKFVDCTVITIAHRLNTIMDADRILVMDAGKVAEFDEPYTLLTNPDSHLSKMVAETGDAADHLISLARQKYNQTNPDTQ